MNKINRWKILALLPLVLLVFSAGRASAADEVRLVIKNHVFSPSEIKVKAGSQIKLVVTNEDPTPEEFESYSLNREKMIRPGQSAVINLPTLKPGVYEFFGEFNPETAKGRIIVE